MKAEEAAKLPNVKKFLVDKYGNVTQVEFHPPTPATPPTYVPPYTPQYPTYPWEHTKIWCATSTGPTS